MYPDLVEAVGTVDAIMETNGMASGIDAISKTRVEVEILDVCGCTKYALQLVENRLVSRTELLNLARRRMRK